MKKIISFLVTIVCLAVLIVGVNLLLRENPEIRAEVEGAFDKVALFFGKEKSDSADRIEKIIYGPYQTVRVIDGDTLLLDMDGEEKRVRLIGVDTPESVNPDESKNSEEGKIASQFTKDLMTDASVFLEYDVQREDNYGRTLAYVYMDRGKTMLQDLLLEAGMASTMTIQPNSKYADHFFQIMVEARKNKSGFWRTGFFEK